MTPAMYVFAATLAVAIANEAAIWAQLALLACFVLAALAGAYEPEPADE